MNIGSIAGWIDTEELIGLIAQGRLTNTKGAGLSHLDFCCGAQPVNRFFSSTLCRIICGIM
jgi:hypothetical protein